MEKKTTAKPKKPQTKKAPAKKTKKPKKPTVNEEVKQVVQEEKPIEEIVDTLDADFEEKPEEKGKTKKTKKKLTNDQVYGIIFLCVFLVFGLFAYVKFKNIWISIGLIGLGVISMLLMFFKDRMHFKGKGSSKGDDRCFKELSRLYLEELMTGVDTKNAFFEAYEGLEPSSFKDELNIDDSLKNNSNQDLSNIFAHSKLNKDNLECSQIILQTLNQTKPEGYQLALLKENLDKSEKANNGLTMQGTKGIVLFLMGVLLFYFFYLCISAL